MICIGCGQLRQGVAHLVNLYDKKQVLHTHVYADCCFFTDEVLNFCAAALFWCDERRGGSFWGLHGFFLEHKVL